MKQGPLSKLYPLEKRSGKLASAKIADPQLRALCQSVEHANGETRREDLGCLGPVPTPISLGRQMERWTRGHRPKRLTVTVRCDTLFACPMPDMWRAVEHR